MLSECSLSEILSLPFIAPDCLTATACSTAPAPRGMTMAPLMVTGSSTTLLNVWPAYDTSTSIGWVRRTLIFVPSGTTTGGFAAGRGAGAASAAGRGVGGGGGAGL